MPVERCWRCQQLKPDVTLCASDDRLCEDCYNENEKQLEANRLQTGDSNPPSQATGTTKAKLSRTYNVRKAAKKTASLPSTSDIVPKTDGTNSCLTKQSSLDTPTGATSVNANSPVINDPTSLLLAELKCQRELISKLQQQLCFVLSRLGVVDQADQRTVNPQTEQSGNDPVC
jgi:hypothetical protein